MAQDRARAYKINLYKDDTFLTSVEVAPGTMAYDFSAVFAEHGPGSYTATVQAMGDRKQWRDGPVSDASDAKVVS